MSSEQAPEIICIGSLIVGDGVTMEVDQTPIQVREALDGAAKGLVEFTFNGVSTYIDADVRVIAIQPHFGYQR